MTQLPGPAYSCTVHLAPLPPPLLRIVQRIPCWRTPIHFHLSEEGASGKCSSHQGRPYARVCLGSVFQQGQVGRLLHVADGGSQQDICGPEAARQRAIRSQNDVDAAGTKCTHGGEAPAQVPPLPSLGIAVPWLFCSIEIADSAISWRQPSVSNGSISRQHPAERP